MIVVKYGGNAMTRDASTDPLLKEVAALHLSGEKIVLVHGGGPEIDAALAERGVTTERIDGQRVTDAATLEVTEAVLCETINKRIAATLQALGVDAAGICGRESRILFARRLRGTNGEDLGYVGEITNVGTKVVESLLAQNTIPVISPIAIEEMRADALNVNADAAAGAIAAALGARALILATNVPRILRDPDDPSSGIDRLTPDQAAIFARSDACRSSMKPKVMAAALAARQNVTSYICSFEAANSIDAILRGQGTVVAFAKEHVYD